MANDAGHHVDDGGDSQAPPLYAPRRRFVPKIQHHWWSWAFGSWSSIWYTAFVLSQVWPDWTPLEIPQATSTYFGFVIVSLVYAVIQFLTMLRATTGRNVTSEGAVLGDAAVSAIFPLIGFGTLGFFYARGEYRPSEMDVQFLVIAMIILALDVAGFTWIAYRANRRGTEVTPES